jgi:glucosyl-3-phosphoglycerate phosphatase
LLVVRHGRTGYNATARIQGQLDVGLDEVGRAQAVAAADWLARLGPDVIVSSDLSRAADTAAALAAVTGLPVRSDPRLRERDFGQWQGLLGSEVAQRHPEEYARWQAGQAVDGCDVEELDDLAKRSSLALQEAADLAPGGTVAVFCHGGTAKYGVVALLGWPSSVLPTVGSMGNCRWADLRRDTVRGWQLRGYNLGEREPADPR